MARILATTLRPGQIVVTDNLSSHKGGRVRELVDERCCELVYLPPIEAPPDLNHIEQAFAKLKTLLRRTPERAHARRS